MKTGFYLKLAVSGMRKNREIYFPYLLTCIGMVMMYYIVSFLSLDPGLDQMSGGSQMRNILGVGVFVIAAFAVAFLFYTNSFLIRRRKKEFGLYNILGMNKWNLSRILLYETILSFLLSVLLGLGCGILFSRLAQFAMIRILGGGAVLEFRIMPRSLADTALLFAGIFALLFLNDLRQIHLTNPIELLHSEQTGEKPPKANWALAVLGAVLLGIAYYIAFTIQSPLEALLWFFVAVLLVIAATYLLFVSGSVAIGTFLRKCKRYYYRTSHFVSTSFMTYRMKRNGAGLASICILSTMVLVMVSSTTCLYIGEESILSLRSPRDIMVYADYQDETTTQEGICCLQEAAAAKGLGQENFYQFRSLSFAAYLYGTELLVDPEQAEELGLGNEAVWSVIVIPIEYYNALFGTAETVEDGEALICAKNGTYTADTVTIEGCEPLRIRGSVEEVGALTTELAASAMYLFVSDLAGLQEVQSALAASGGGQSMPVIRDVYGCDLQGSLTSQVELRDQLRAELPARVSLPAESVSLSARAELRSSFYSTYGGLFFLGVLLGLVFVFAVALIMYYKQIVEGYEDCGKFDILQKVGMTDAEVKRSIRSSVLTVFFLPLLLAGVHVLAAFPIISKLLVLFGMENTKLFLLTVLGCFLAFSAFYSLMYLRTSRAYYRIVRR